MIGGTALSFAELGWIRMHPTPFSVPEWMGSWFEIYPYWETIGAQVLAGRPRRRLLRRSPSGSRCAAR